MVTIDNYVRAQNLEEAYELNSAKNSRIIGGMLWIKLSNNKIKTAIDLSDLGLNRIEEDDKQFSIGSMVTLRDIELNESLNAYTNNSIRNSVKDIVGVQFRNMATVGGSIWGRFGFSDVLTVFLALDSYVELYKGGIIPLSEFVNMKRDKDILVRIIVKKTPLKVSYSSVRNQRTDFPVLTCATSVIDGVYKVAIGARPKKAMLVTDSDNILASGVNETNINAFAEYVANNIPTSSNLRGSSEYRTHLIKVLTERNIKNMEGIS